MYCGDETGSFIGDIGSCSARFGYGGNNVPSYVVPSMVMTQQQQQQQQQETRRDGNNNNNTVTTSGTSKICKSTIPTSCYNYKYGGHPLDDDKSIVYDYRVPMRRVVQCPSSSSLFTTTATSRTGTNSSNDTLDEMQPSSTVGPITDPTFYLQQGDSIDDWDAYEHLWMNAIDTLAVKNTYKHTTGRIATTTTSTSTNDDELQSTTIRSGSTSTTAMGDNRCTHPILVVSPGIIHTMHPNGPTGNIEDTTSLSSLSMMNRSKKEILQITELMMESFDAKAMYIAPAPMLSSFAHGRQTALIVDIGASGTRVTPVVDGLLLKQSQRRSGRGTDWIQNCIWQALIVQQQSLQERQSLSSSKTTFNLTPRYQIKRNRSVASKTNETTPHQQQYPHGIFHRWAMNDLMYEIRTSEHIALPHWWYDPSVPFIYNDGDDDVMMVDGDEDEDINPNSASTGGDHPQYELPDGTHINLSTRIGKDICRVPELFFSEMCPFIMTSPSSQLLSSSSSSLDRQHPTLSNAPLHQLIHQSLSAVSDVDLRRELASTIILTGGGSAALPNLASRLSLELSRITSSTYKPKVLASGYGTTITSSSTAGANTTNGSNKSHQSTSIERQCSAWIGGSILTSLGSFQQLWLSKAEYDEYGGTLAIQRFQ